MRIFLLLLISSLFATPVWAANHFVRAGAAGASNGTNWTDAWDDLPATLTRGDTYYMADGSYASYTFDDALSGTTYIYFKKATSSDHGTETGWSSAYGDGTATWARWVFSSGYYDFDGQTGGGPGSWETGFGFKVSSTKGKRVIFNPNISYFNIRHAEITNTDATPNDIGYGSLVYAFQNVTNVLFSYTFNHHVFGCNFQNGYNGSDYWTIEYSKVGDCYGTSSKHSEIWSTVGNDNWTWRYNYFYQWRSTGALICINGVYGQRTDNNFCSDWDIYGNIFDQDGSTTSKVIASYADNTDETFSRRWNVHNNTFIALESTANWVYPIVTVTSGEANNYFYNNVMYDPQDPMIVGIQYEDYNSYQLNDQFFTGANDELITADPFTDYANKDYTLSFAMSGTALADTYNTDMNGNTRGADGTWDRGAFEYGSGTTPPANVTSQSATGGDQQVTINWTNPADADFTGVRIRSRTDTYPTSPTNGTLVADNTGSASATDSQVHSSLNTNQIYYYALYAYDASTAYATGATTSASTDTNINIHNILRGGSISGDMK